jgi:hypothetical protein
MTIVELLGWVLLHFVWQGAIIALALAVLLALTCEAQARLRYLLSCAALVLMLGAALATATRVRTIPGAVLQADAPVASGPSQVTPLSSGGPRAGDGPAISRTSSLRRRRARTRPEAPSFSRSSAARCRGS